jgi:hypothetical protein
MLILSEKQIKVFWSKVLRTDNESCWLWQSSLRGNNKYGSIGFNRRYFCAHRVAYAIAHDISDIDSFPDSVIMHSCDVPQCVAPHHLSLGTQADNIADCKAKGRLPTQYGDDNGRSKLDKDKVREIRRLRASNPSVYTNKVLADMYGVGAQNISPIILGRTWKNI